MSESRSVNNQCEKMGKKTTNKKIKRKYFQTYSEADMINAILQVNNENKSLNSVAKSFGIPQKTLYNRIKLNTSNVHGKSTLLSHEIECEIVQWIKDCAKMGDPRTKEDVLRAAAELSMLSEDESKHFKNVLPSSRWMSGFLKRHPDVSFRTPSSVTRAAANVTKEDIVKFIVDLRHYIEENYPSVLDDPMAWGNSDETNFELNPVPSNVLAKKGAKNVYRVETAKPKENISVLYTFLASGVALNPQLILKKVESERTIQDMAFAAGGKY